MLQTTLQIACEGVAKLDCHFACLVCQEITCQLYQRTLCCCTQCLFNSVALIFFNHSLVTFLFSYNSLFIYLFIHLLFLPSVL